MFYAKNMIFTIAFWNAQEELGHAFFFNTNSRRCTLDNLTGLENVSSGSI